MNKISCDICMDLIPLVKDGVSSKDSYDAVIKHSEECKDCRELLNETKTENHEISDEKIIYKIKNQLMLGAIILVVLGSLIGIGISESSAMFYNILIMPIIGILAFFALRKRSYIVVISMFIMVYVYPLIKYLCEGMFEEGQIISVLVAPATWAFIYSGLCLVGVVIGFLLYIAFKKENR